MSDSEYKIRGLRPADIVATAQRVRETKNTWDRLQDKIDNDGKNFFKRAFGMGVMAALAFPMSSYVLIPMAGALMLYASAKGSRTLTPFGTMPKVAGEYNPKKDAYYGPDGSKLTGILFMATDDETGGEYWINKDYMCRHMGIFGTTGAGKTEGLLSICFGTLLLASGYMFIDAKGTFELYAKAYNTARLFGREDDMLLLSYLTGDQDVRADYTAIKVSNTMNILADATHDGMTQTLGSLIPQAGGDNQVWTGMALNLIEVALAILSYRRDYLKQVVSLKALQELLIFKNLFYNWENARKVRDDPSHPHYLPEWVYEGLYNFLNSLTGFRDDKTFEEQTPDVFKYFSFASMQFGKILGSFSGLYGYIFNAEYSEINLRDVLLNRRIVIGLLPSLGKSPTELKQMGNTMVTCAKQMYASLLGDRAEGTLEDILENSPAFSNEPQVTIFDEWGQIAPEKGAAVIPQQTRALNICSIFAGQEVAAFGPEARSVIGSCDLLIGMKLKDSGDTFNLFREKAGEADAQVLTGSRFLDDKKYQENDTVQFERRSVLNFADFEAQTQGQAHFMTNGTFIRGRFPYIAIPMPSRSVIKVNQFLAMAKPDSEQIARLQNAYAAATANIVHSSAGNHTSNKTSGNIRAIQNMFRNVQEHRSSTGDDFATASQAAACAVLSFVARQSYEKARAYQREQDKKQSAQVLFFKPKQLMQAALQQYADGMADLHKKLLAVPPAGMGEEAHLQAALKLQAGVQANVPLAQKNVLLNQRFINTGLYPKNNLPEKTPPQMRQIIRSVHEGIITDNAIIKRQQRLGR